MGQSVSRRTPEVQPQPSQDASDNSRRRRWSTAFRPSSLRFNSSSSTRYSTHLTSSPSMAPNTSTHHHSSQSPARRPTRLCRARTSISDTLPRLLGRTRRPPMRYSQSLSMPSESLHTSEMERRTLNNHLESTTTQDRYESLEGSDDTIMGGLDNEQISDLPLLDTPLHESTSARSTSPLARFRDMIPRNTLRRRRSQRRVEDQTTMLTDLLSAAAAATANSILGSEAGSASTRNLAGDENGAFGDFLAQLREGNIAGALRTGDNRTGTEQNTLSQDLNFFRMFRFGATDASATSGGATEQDSSQDTASTYTSDNNASGEASMDGRMVPIIIVGIRSINPGSQANDSMMPPFFDSLSGLAPETPSNTTIDALMRPPRNNASFSHRRRTSDTLRRLGSLQQATSAMSDSSRPEMSELRRRHSTTSDSLLGPRPPPSTPASTGLSAFSSGTTTPTTSAATPVGSLSAAASRRGSLNRRANSSGDTLTEPLLRQPRIPRTRRFSEDFDTARHGAGSSRRNGLVGLDNSTDNSENEPHRSWIIYVLGGSYPENHPLLSTPSLFTDNPQYEDMLLLASLLGPAKPPVATEEEIARASGLYKISLVEAGSSRLQAIEVLEQAADSAVTTEPKTIAIADEERCLVCLCDYEADEEARRLQCCHMYHRECIDQWLLTGRNSCPLCRTEGVQKTPEEPAVSEVVTEEAATTT